MKKYLYTIGLILAVLLTPVIVTAAQTHPVQWDRFIPGAIRPLFPNDHVVIGPNATTTSAKLEVQGNIAVTGASTSTFSNGINLTTGCFSVGGSCITGSGGGGGTGPATSTNPLMYTYSVSTSTTATSTYAGPVSIKGYPVASSTCVSYIGEDCLYQVSPTSTSSDLQINAAMLAVSNQGGGDVHIKHGTFILHDLLQIPSNVNLYCDSQNTVIKADNGYNPATSVYGTGSRRVMVIGYNSAAISNSSIRNCTFDGNVQNIPGLTSNSAHRIIWIESGTNVTLDHNKFFNGINYTIFFRNSSQIWVQNNVVLGGYSSTYNQNDGIHIRDSNNYYIQNNYVDTKAGGLTSGDDAIVAVIDTNATQDMKGGVITGNTVNGAGSRGIIGDIDTSFNITDLVISNNTITNTFDAGIKLYTANSRTGQYYGVNIEGNVLSSIATTGTDGGYGIFLDKDFGGDRNLFNDVTISGNTIRTVYYASGWGINVIGGAKDLVISHNNINDIVGLGGIKIGSSGNPIRDFTMDGNHINISSSTTNGVGIYLSRTLHGEVSGNQLLGNTNGTSYGVYIDGDATNVSSSNDVSHNQFNAFDNGISEVNAGADPNNNQFFGNVFNSVTTNITKLGVSSTIFGEFASNFGFNTAVPAAFMQLATPNQNGGPNSVLGEVFRVDNATFTDISTAGSGTATGYVTNSLGQETIAATNASVTTTNASNLYIVGAPVKGTNNTVTNTHGIYVAAGSVGAQTNSYGLTVNAQTGATNNFVAEFLGGNVGIGTTTPGSLLSIGNTGGINFIPTATSTFSGSANGINITNGCYAIAGTCISGGAGTTPSIGGTLTSATAGSVLFAGSGTFAQDNANIFYDDTNNRLGIGTTTPWGQLSIHPNGIGSGVPEFVIGSSTKTHFIVNGGGLVGIGTTSPTFSLQIEGTNTSLLKVVNTTGTGSSGGGGLQAQDGVTPTAVDDRLGFLLFGANGASAAGISAAADQAWTLGSAQGAYLKFETTLNSGTTRAEKMRLTNAGLLGIGTTSPYATLSVQSGASTGDAFAVATSSGAAVFGIDNDGHTFTSGPAPVISACGTGTGTVVGDDQSGTITTATAATACTMTFAKAYRNTPTCRVTDNSLVGFADVASISTSAVTFGISSALTGGLLFYDCKYHK